MCSKDYITAASKMDVISVDDLIVAYAQFRCSHGKALVILRSVSGITSLISSSMMIWMILRSLEGLSTPKHRLLFGLCMCDILASLSYSTFNLMSPSDIDYSAWNVRGYEATCTAQGFLATLGGYGGLFYNSALNLYFLAVVKYEKGDIEIRTKIEPFLHGVPIAISVSYSIARLVKDQYNADDKGATPCMMFVNYPPHCQGHGVGETRDGFEIPCGRGLDWSWTSSIIGQALMIIPVLIMIVSLGIIYRCVRKIEEKLGKYGVNALRATIQNRENSSEQDASDARLSSTLVSSIRSSISWLRKSNNRPIARSNNTRSKSRAVLHKAFGYSFFWFLSYGIIMIGIIMKVVTNSFPLAVNYLTAILYPLQGLFNLLIYMHPEIMAARRRCRNISWCGAFIQVLLSRDSKSRKKKASRRTGKRGDNKHFRKRAMEDATRVSMEQVKRAKTRIERDHQKEEEKCEIKPQENLSHCKGTSKSMYASNISPSVYCESSENNKKLKGRREDNGEILSKE